MLFALSPSFISASIINTVLSPHGYSVYFA